MKNKIVIGIDQSYADSGIAIVFNNRLMSVNHCKLPSTATHIERRRELRRMLATVFEKMKEKAKNIKQCEVVCFIERIRLQSAKPGEQHFINFSYIKGIGALNATIVDTADLFGIPVYSVDTRSWKSQVVGTSSPEKNTFGFPIEKWPTIKWCLNKGYEWAIIEEVSVKKKKGVIERRGLRYTYNDNKADAIGIAMYGFIPMTKQKLERER